MPSYRQKPSIHKEVEPHEYNELMFRLKNGKAGTPEARQRLIDKIENYGSIKTDENGNDYASISFYRSEIESMRICVGPHIPSPNPIPNEFETLKQICEEKKQRFEETKAKPSNRTGINAPPITDNDRYSSIAFSKIEGFEVSPFRHVALDQMTRCPSRRGCA